MLDESTLLHHDSIADGAREALQLCVICFMDAAGFFIGELLRTPSALELFGKMCPMLFLMALQGLLTLINRIAFFTAEYHF
jgi:hypothetical protein